MTVFILTAWRTWNLTQYFKLLWIWHIYDIWSYSYADDNSIMYKLNPAGWWQCSTQTCIWKIPSSNLDQVTSYPNGKEWNETMLLLTNHTITSHFSNTHFNKIHPSTSTSPMRFLHLKFSNENFVSISHLMPQVLSILSSLI
jgi:hypothetical protein